MISIKRDDVNLWGCVLYVLLMGSAVLYAEFFDCQICHLISLARLGKGKPVAAFRHAVYLRDQCVVFFSFSTPISPSNV